MQGKLGHIRFSGLGQDTVGASWSLECSDVEDMGGDADGY